MRAAVVDAAGRVSVGTVEDPAPGPRQVVAAVSVPHCFGRTVDLLVLGVVDAATRISHTFPLDRSPEASHAFRAGTGHKLQIRPADPGPTS